MKLEFDLSAALKEIKKRKVKLVLLQFPEGLKTKSEKIAMEIEKRTRAKTVTLVSPCFGACDIPISEIKQFQAGLAIHFGHSQMIPSKNIVYVPLKYSVEKKKLEKLAKKAIEELRKRKFKKIGLASTIQFTGHLQETKKYFTKHKLKVFVGKANGMSAGQVLGCNAETSENVKEKVQCFVFIGDGLFHPQWIAFSTKKPVFLLDPLANSFKELDKWSAERMERGSIARTEIARKAKSYGLLVSTKPGQFNLRQALKLKELAEKKKKKAFIFASDTIREEFLLGLNVECFVGTACPRMIIDDAKHWSKRLVSAEELRKALK